MWLLRISIKVSLVGMIKQKWSYNSDSSPFIRDSFTRLSQNGAKLYFNDSSRNTVTPMTCKKQLQLLKDNDEIKILFEKMRLGGGHR